MRLAPAGRRRAVAATLPVAVALSVLFLIRADGPQAGVTPPVAAAGVGVPVRELDRRLAAPPPRDAVDGLQHPSEKEGGWGPARRGRTAECDAGAAVAVELGGLGCARAAAVARAGAGPTDETAGLICTADGVGLSRTCVDPETGDRLTLTYGPGSAALRDCGQAAIGAEPAPVPIRASIDCAKASRIAFEYMENPARRLDGYTCSPRRQAGVGVVDCTGRQGRLAFAAPGAV